MNKHPLIDRLDEMQQRLDAQTTHAHAVPTVGGPPAGRQVAQGPPARSQEGPRFLCGTAPSLLGNKISRNDNPTVSCHETGCYGGEVPPWRVYSYDACLPPAENPPGLKSNSGSRDWTGWKDWTEVWSLTLRGGWEAPDWRFLGAKESVEELCAAKSNSAPRCSRCHEPLRYDGAGFLMQCECDGTGLWCWKCGEGRLEAGADGKWSTWCERCRGAAVPERSNLSQKVGERREVLAPARQTPPAGRGLGRSWTSATNFVAAQQQYRATIMASMSPEYRRTVEGPDYVPPEGVIDRRPVPEKVLMMSGMVAGHTFEGVGSDARCGCGRYRDDLRPRVREWIGTHGHAHVGELTEREYQQIEEMFAEEDRIWSHVEGVSSGR